MRGIVFQEHFKKRNWAKFISTQDGPSFVFSPLMVVLEPLEIFPAVLRDHSALLLTLTCCTSLGVVAGTNISYFGRLALCSLAE